ncbi:hypothetical protein E3N88_31415 [Mikania micrantha]|uniref:Flavin-containing monooxygenase n=1 Tax=Mikania micrantha TaxID=192012 RepID=A0A5N6MPB9_9ASTR|nr:hypothetical protein E3N88_31415 [Mikania micrantha]
MVMDKKQIAIIGAGVSGLTACKHCLSKGFNPIVFEAESQVGGVWTKTIRTTRLQLPREMYQFSDFPWPPSVTDTFPTQQQVLDYARSYATHFNLIPHINFNSRVKGMSYDGPSSDTWSLWNGTGEAFPPEGKWNVTVENTQTGTTKVYTVDFVILCLGRFRDVPNMPKFPEGKGPEVFQGQAIHSMEYSAMDNNKAAELVKGKKVVVVGFGKTGLDIARECASVNGPEHPCTIVYRRDHWKMGSWFPLGIPLMNLISGRFHNTQIEADIVIFATGFNGPKKLKDIFESPAFGHFIEGPPLVGLYRESIPPRIPQVAIVGFSEGLSSLYVAESTSRWLVALLEGKFKLPSTKEMEKDVARCATFRKQICGECYHSPVLCGVEIWYNDQICKDMGMNPMRKKGLFPNLFEPYGPRDYAEI